MADDVEQRGGETWLLDPGARVDHFEVQRPLGRGGMAEVYLARDTKLGRKVALKLIRPELLGDASAVERFIFEAKATASFSHPNIVAIYAVGDWEGKPYIALEYLEGDTLRARADRGLSGAEITQIALSIAEALAEAHRGKLIHRDLKPDNIMLGRDGRLRVVDFGLARVISRDELTAELERTATLSAAEASVVLGALESTAGCIRGTPLYMAPEQWRDEVTSGATDVWALGVILYELISGQLPYRAASAVEIALQVCAETPAPEPTLLATVPPPLGDLAAQCLEKKPEARPPAEVVAAQLRRLQARLAQESPDVTLPPTPLADRAAAQDDAADDAAAVAPTEEAVPVAATEQLEAATTVRQPELATGTASMTLEIRGTAGIRRAVRAPGGWIYGLLVLGAIALLGVSAREAYLFLQTPQTGLFMRSDGALVADARWPTLAAGTGVSAIDGRPVASRRDFLQAMSRAQLGSVLVTFIHDGDTREVRAKTTRRGPAEIALVALRVLLGAASFFIGALAFFVHPGTKVSWLFLIFCSGVSLVSVGPIGMYRNLSLWLTVTFCGFALAAAVAPHLFVKFPVGLRIGRVRPAIVLLPYAVCAGVLGVCLVRALTVQGFDYGLAPPLLAVASGLSVVALLFLQHRAARRAGDALSRARCRTLITGVVIGLLFPALLNAARTFFARGDAPLWAHLNAVPMFAFVGLTGFAIVRQNVLSVDRFTAAVVGYGVTLIGMGTLFIAALLGVVAVTGRGALFRHPLANVLLGAVAVLSFMPLYRRLKRGVDRWFYRDYADGSRAAETLRELAHTIHVADRAESLAAALRVGMTVLVERLEIWFLDEHGERLTRVAAEGRPVGSAELASAGPLGAVLANAPHAIGLAGIAAHAAPADAQAELWERELALAVPVKTFGGNAGFVGVGRKRSGLPFSPQEEAFFSAIASQLTLFFERERTGTRRLGQYRLERRIGVGGMAEVFLAWQLGPEGFERKVAVKRLLPSFAADPDAVEMFLDEARIAAQLTHRNIVQIYEVADGGGAYFIVMEYVEGPSVRELLRLARRRQRPVPVPVALEIGDAVLAALDHAHARVDRHGNPLSVVHRDVTPANIHVTWEGEVKLLDFGIARAATQVHVTRTGMARGTLPYMSPEQAAGRALDHRSDLYSLGAVLYELLSGSKAFPHGPSGKSAPSLTGCREGLVDGIAQLVARALCRQAAQRFASAAEMRRALGEVRARIDPDADVGLAAWIAAVRGDADKPEGGVPR